MIIGAGPAGIAAVGKLLDSGISAQKIGWMDPFFQVGDLGKKWSQVSSNTEVALFLRFLLDCKAFAYKDCSKSFAIDQLRPEDTCLLENIAKPLQWITDHLKQKVIKIQDKALTLNLMNNRWKVKTEKSQFFTKNLILATGCAERKLTYPDIEEIPLDSALNLEKLEKSYWSR